MALPEDPIEWAMRAFHTDGKKYERYQKYAVGDQDLSYATDKFKSAFGNQFREFSYNRCSMVIDAHADRLQVIDWDHESGQVTEAANDIWDANNMDVREGMIEADMFGLGDGYAMVQLDQETGDVQIWPQSPHVMRVCYSDESPGKVEMAAKVWTEGKTRRLNLYFPDRIEKYLTRKQFNESSKSTIWEPYQPDGDLTWPVLLPISDTVPVFHFANNARINEYGQSELRDVLSIQDALNKTVMDMLVTMEFAAFPQRVLINVDTDDKLTQEAIKEFALGIDRMLSVMGDKDGNPASISEFTAAQITQYTEVADLFDKAVSRVSKVPVHYLAMSTDLMSGVARRLAEAPFVAKIEDRQRACSPIWSQIMSYALRLGGELIEPGSLQPIWKSAAPLSIDDELDNALKLVSIGVPLEFALRGVSMFDADTVIQIVETVNNNREQMARQFNAGLITPLPTEESAA